MLRIHKLRKVCLYGAYSLEETHHKQKNSIETNYMEHTYIMLEGICTIKKKEKGQDGRIRGFMNEWKEGSLHS